MKLSSVEPHLLAALGLLVTASEGCTQMSTCLSIAAEESSGSGSGTGGTTGTETTGGAGTTGGTTGGTTSADVTTGPCLSSEEGPMSTSSDGSGTGTGTGSGSGSGSGGATTGGMAAADVAERVLDSGALPADLVARLRRRSRPT